MIFLFSHFTNKYELGENKRKSDTTCQIALVKECTGEKELIFIKMLSAARASSARAKRMLSTFGLVYTNLRNQLGVEKAANHFKFKRVNVENAHRRIIMLIFNILLY